MTAKTHSQPPAVDGLIGLMKEKTRFGPDKPQTSGEQLNHFFDELIEHSGLEVRPSLALAAVMAVAMSLAGAMFVWQESLLSAAMGLMAGLVVSVLFLRVLRSWRFRQILRQLPEAVDIMSRSVRAGRSLEQSIEEVSRELAAPLGDEFKRVSARVGLGLSVAAAAREMPRRVPLPGVHILATALAIHQQTGGDLIHVLDQLAETIRERAEFQGKFMAATAGSRFSIIFLLSIGPIILIYQSMRDPTYLETLTGSSVGRTILVSAIILQLIGSLWILNIFRSGVSETEL